jgi:hypothetical protein
MLFKLIFILRNKNYFIINNLDCSSIIKPFLLESFFGKMQEELINGIAIESFLKSIKIKNFLNYLEFYPSSRSIYYFIKSVKDLDIKIITINHTTYSDNLYLQIDKNYFSKKRDYLFYSPKPDFFLTQGLNFLNKLKKSFSKNYVCAIGNLKIELEDLSTIKEKIFFFKKSRKKILTIITSYNDNYDFIDILNKCDLRDYLVVVRNHPYLRNDIDDFERDFKHSFVTYDNFSTRGIMSASDLILTGDSSLAYDAIIRSKKVLRVVNYNKPILFVDSSIPTVDNHILMQKYLDKKISFKHISKNKIIRDFFYKYDQLAHKRLSNFLKKL